MTYTQPDPQGTEYRVQHNAIRYHRGSASGYVCVDCPEKAQHWSWRHGCDPNNVNSYDPRCIRCHIKYDGYRDKGGKTWGERHKGIKPDALFTPEATEARMKGLSESRGRKQKNNTSGVPGVSWHKTTSKWSVNVYGQGKMHYGGVFADFFSAVEARNALAVELLGQGARQYHPVEIPQIVR